jgi:hypothetical protein
MTTTRTTAARLARLDTELTERERELLGTLAKLRLACTRQLEALHFTSGSPLANARHARRTLGKLMALGLVSRLERRVGGVRAGSAGYVWSLGPAGQAITQRRGPAGGTKLQSPWTPSRAFLAHRLATSGLYVDLVLADRDGDLDLVRFDPEPAAWRSYVGPHGARLVLKPDAFLQIGLGKYLDGYFVEVDLGTESTSALGRKLAAYRTYWLTGREQSTSDGVFPFVAFLVPTTSRAKVVNGVIRRQPDDTRPLFRTALLPDAVKLFTSGAEL